MVGKKKNRARIDQKEQELELIKPENRTREYSLVGWRENRIELVGGRIEQENWLERESNWREWVGERIEQKIGWRENRAGELVRGRIEQEKIGWRENRTRELVGERIELERIGWRENRTGETPTAHL